MLHHYYFEIGGSLLLVVSAVIKVVLWRINVRHAVVELQCMNTLKSFTIVSREETVNKHLSDICSFFFFLH